MPQNFLGRGNSFLPQMSSSSSSESFDSSDLFRDTVDVRRPKRDKSPVRKATPKFADSGFDSVVFECLLPHCNAYLIWFMINVCRHWRYMVKVKLGTQLEEICDRWCRPRRQYGRVSVFYNFYYLKMISLGCYERLRAKIGFAPQDFKGTCLAPFGVSSLKIRDRSFMKHAKWINRLKSRKSRDEKEHKQLTLTLHYCISFQLNFSTLKHILLKVANNSALEGDKIITLQMMTKERIPAKLIQIYFAALNKRNPNNMFAAHRRRGFSNDHLPYFRAARAILLPLFPQFYMFVITTMIRNTPTENVGFDEILTELLSAHEADTRQGFYRFDWLHIFVQHDKLSKLTEMQLSRFLPVIKNYMELQRAAGYPSSIKIESNILMALIFQNAIPDAAILLLWMISDPQWKHRNRAVITSFLRKSNSLGPTIEALQPYLIQFRQVNQDYTLKVAEFLRFMMDEKTWKSRKRWEIGDVVEKLLAVAHPDSLRALIGLIYYPHRTPAKFLVHDFDLQSQDPLVVRYNFLKMQSAIPL